MVLGGALGLGFVTCDAQGAAPLCVAGVALGDVHLDITNSHLCEPTPMWMFATPVCFWTVWLLDIFGKTCTVSVITMVLACDCDCVVSSIVALTTSYIRVLHFCGQVPFLYVIIVGCIHTYMHACIHTYLPTILHTHIHTHIHTYIPFYLLDLSPPPLSFLPSLSPLKPLKLILGRSWLVGLSGPLICKFIYQ